MKKQKRKFRNPYKQKAFEQFTGKNKHDLEQFNRIWKRSISNVRRLFDFGKYKDFGNISEKAEVFAEDEIIYNDVSINQMLETAEGKNFHEKYENTMLEIYNRRTKEFFRQNGSGEIKFNGETKSLNDWKDDFNNGLISKDDMNRIIKEYKEQNPDRAENYSDSNANNEDFKEYFG